MQKVYQVKYSHYGSTKYCYTSNFIDCYEDFNLTKLIKEKPEFYEKLQQVQKDKAIK